MVCNNHRCNYIVFDSITKRNRKCKKTFSFFINESKYCYHHANKDYWDIISKIQAIVRGNICRSKLIRLKEMPTDIQYIITSYVREDFENSRYNCQLSNFLVKKIYKIICHISGNNRSYFDRWSLGNIRFNLRNMDNLLQIIHIIKLCKKYKSILNYNKKYTSPHINSLDCTCGFKNFSLKYIIKLIVNDIILCDYWLHPVIIKQFRSGGLNALKYD